MILNIEPVPDIFSLSVNGNRLAGLYIVYCQWYKLLRELVGAVIV